MKRPNRSGQDEVDGDEEDELLSGGATPAAGEKKRRLCLEQVRALEACFDVDGKLDSERKVHLAHDVGLSPRQVAVWFQNRRARWKTKLLEREYAAVRSSYDALAADCDSLRRDNATLLAEIKELRAMTEGREASEKKPLPPAPASDSDSSAALNGEICRIPFVGGNPLLPEPDRRQEDPQSLLVAGFPFDFQLWDLLEVEQSLFSDEELCSDFFPDERNPAFSWYNSGRWS